MQKLILFIGLLLYSISLYCQKQDRWGMVSSVQLPFSLSKNSGYRNSIGLNFEKNIGNGFLVSSTVLESSHTHNITIKQFKQCAMMKVGDKFYYQFGGYMGWLLSTRANSPEVTRNIKANFSPCDLGLVYGLGMRLGYFTFEYRYKQSLLNAVNNDFLKVNISQCFNVWVGVSLPINKV